jgi:hypothetical protein
MRFLPNGTGRFLVILSFEGRVFPSSFTGPLFARIASYNRLTPTSGTHGRGRITRGGVLLTLRGSVPLPLPVGEGSISVENEGFCLRRRADSLSFSLRSGPGFAALSPAFHLCDSPTPIGSGASGPHLGCLPHNTLKISFSLWVI